MRLPERMSDLAKAAAYFGEQYECTTRIEARGRVTDEWDRSLRIPTWREVGMLDFDLDLLGLGEVDWEDEQLAWVRGTRSTEVRLSPMERDESSDT